MGSKAVRAAAPRIEGEARLGYWAAVKPIKAAAPRIEGKCTSSSLTSFFRATTSSSRLCNQHSRASTLDTVSRRSSSFSTSQVSHPSIYVGYDERGRSTARVGGAVAASSNINGSSLASCQGLSEEQTPLSITSALCLLQLSPNNHNFLPNGNCTLLDSALLHP